MELKHFALPSLVFIGVWLAALLLAEVWRLFWNWIDDHEHPIQRNPVMTWVINTFFHENADGLDVWIQVVLIAFWPLYLAGSLVYFLSLQIRELRRRYKLRNGKAVDA
ncbi:MULTISPECIES: hypothetical protein [unclassified Pseudomonas]|uniref:hypothetical protein n=1 Tax=unclassified Pseudomonas TaxID=196821 RepID=UPI000A1DF121|nr:MULTISPECIES: hypothetical protein [unclassified Pseudomonas]MDI2144766.1 hypothetical protein [Pseudomonas sp. ITA]